VFVVHADAAADEAFVNGYLLAKLGLAPERVLRLQTLELGRFIIEEVERGVRSSRVTIAVLSSAYMDDHWAVFGEQLAAYASVAKDVHGAAPAPAGGLQAHPAEPSRAPVRAKVAAHPPQAAGSLDVAVNDPR